MARLQCRQVLVDELNNNNKVTTTKDYNITSRCVDIDYPIEQQQHRGVHDIGVVESSRLSNISLLSIVNDYSTSTTTTTDSTTPTFAELRSVTLDYY